MNAPCVLWDENDHPVLTEMDAVADCYGFVRPAHPTYQARVRREEAERCAPS